MPKETPILFSAAMVLAILQLLKTVTRRGITTLRGFGRITEFGKTDTPGYDWHFRDREMLWRDLRNDKLLTACPYGKVGDRLWVKETWRPQQIDADGQFRITYAADRHFRDFPGEQIPDAWNEPKAADRGNVTPLFMPRWASRITLEITDIRVERLHDITEQDAIAEGSQVAIATFNPPLSGCLTERTAFANIWKRINGVKSWDANPYVWVVTFKWVEGEVANG